MKRKGEIRSGEIYGWDIRSRLGEREQEAALKYFGKGASFSLHCSLIKMLEKSASKTLANRLALRRSVWSRHRDRGRLGAWEKTSLVHLRLFPNLSSQELFKVWLDIDSLPASQWDASLALCKYKLNGWEASQSHVQSSAAGKKDFLYSVCIHIDTYIQMSLEPYRSVGLFTVML